MLPVGMAAKLVGGALSALALVGALGWALHTYNAMVRAEDRVAAQAAQMTQMQSDHLHIVGGLNMAAAAASTRAQRDAAIMGAINAAQSSKCPLPASVRAVMDGRRMHAVSPNGAGAAPASP